MLIFWLKFWKLFMLFCWKTLWFYWEALAFSSLLRDSPDSIDSRARALSPNPNLPCLMTGMVFLRFSFWKKLRAVDDIDWGSLTSWSKIT